MTLIELYQNDPKMRDVLTKIMRQRIRMKYRRELIQEALTKHGIDLGYISTGDAYKLHYEVHPDQPKQGDKPSGWSY